MLSHSLSSYELMHYIQIDMFTVLSSYCFIKFTSILDERFAMLWFVEKLSDTPGQVFNIAWFEEHYTRIIETFFNGSQARCNDSLLTRNKLEQILPHPNFSFHKLDLVERSSMKELFANEKFDVVVHLAAQAGVKYSLENPYTYIDSNLSGFLNILEGCRHNPVEHLIYASSSSVCGANTKMSFSVNDNVDHPVSL